MGISEKNNQKKLYIPEIDGFRAIAILAVLVNHIDFKFLKSGYLGVDIFFVISGYVITKSVMNQNFSGFFDFIKYFFERRIKRLLPALLFYVIVISIIICLFNPYPNVSIRTGFFSLLGLSNFYLFKYSTDYFAQASYLNPFINTWSLAVEEQFYLIFPGILYLNGLFNKKRKSNFRLIQTIFILSIFSLILFLRNYYLYSSFSYFLLPTRFWEIGFGVLTFLTLRKFEDFFLKKLSNNLLQLQLLGILILFLVLFSANQFSQFKTLIVVLITSLFLISFEQKTFINKILSKKPLVYIGKLSYSLYLWHWGIISLSIWIYGKESNPFIILVLIFLISFISFRFIENPLRKCKWRISFLGTYKLTLLIIASSFLFIYKLGESKLMRYKLISIVTKNEIDPESFYLSQNVPGTTINRQNCHSPIIDENNSFKNVFQNCSYSFTTEKKNQPRNIFLAGDSHSYALRNLIANLSEKYGTQYTSISGTMFPSNTYWYKSKSKPYVGNSDVLSTTEYMEYILKDAASKDIVIISNRLPTIYSEPLNDVQRLLHTNAIFFNKEGKSISRLESLDLWFKDLESFIQKATSKNISIIYVMPVPEFKESAQACLFSANREKCMVIDKEFLIENYADIYNKFHIISKRNPQVKFVDPFKDLCDEKKCNMSGLSFDKQRKVSYYMDNNHLSLAGSKKLYRQFDDILKKLITTDSINHNFSPFKKIRNIDF